MKKCVLNLCCMSGPSLSLPVSCQYLHCKLPKRNKNVGFSSVSCFLFTKLRKFAICSVVIWLIIVCIKTAGLNPCLMKIIFIIPRCPPGYAGLSCEMCSPAFERVPGGSYLGTCAGCNCNGHATACDPISGHCLVNVDSLMVLITCDNFEHLFLLKG